jgi:two-component system, NarL family, nitrate/nitrite response regulator NarL
VIPRAVRVLVADDHPPALETSREALVAGGYLVCAQATTGAEAVEQALATTPDVCLLDVHMPGGGIVAAAAIMACLPDTHVVMLTVSTSDEDLLGALRAGAAGYLLKGMDPRRLPAALEAVLAGEVAMPRVLVNRLVDEIRDHGTQRVVLPGRRPVTLTSREREVLAGLRRDLSTRQIAEHLHIAPVTVRTHVAALLRKFRVPDRDAIVALFEGQPEDPGPAALVPAAARAAP